MGAVASVKIYNNTVIIRKLYGLLFSHIYF